MCILFKIFAIVLNVPVIGLYNELRNIVIMMWLLNCLFYEEIKD